MSENAWQVIWRTEGITSSDIETQTALFLNVRKMFIYV